nr:hypothetical protein [Tanacetum cinerariifolium]
MSSSYLNYNHNGKVKEIRAKRLARTANPLALVAQQQPVYDPQTILKTIPLTTLKIPQPDHNKLLPEIELSVKQVDWKDDTHDEPEDQELEAHYLYMAKIQEVNPDSADNSRPIFNAEPLQKVQNVDDNYNMFANYREHHAQPESVNDTYPDKQGDMNITTDSLDMSNNGGEANHDDDYLARECDLLASLIKKLKCEIDESKDRNKLLESLSGGFSTLFNP